MLVCCQEQRLKILYRTTTRTKRSGDCFLSTPYEIDRGDIHRVCRGIGHYDAFYLVNGEPVAAKIENSSMYDYEITWVYILDGTVGDYIPLASPNGKVVTRPAFMSLSDQDHQAIKNIGPCLGTQVKTLYKAKWERGSFNTYEVDFNWRSCRDFRYCNLQDIINQN